MAIILNGMRLDSNRLMTYAAPKASLLGSIFLDFVTNLGQACNELKFIQFSLSNAHLSSLCKQFHMNAKLNVKGKSL